MSLETALWQYLLTQTAVTDVVGDRLYRDAAPTDRGQDFPYLTYTQSGEEPIHALQGFVSLTNARLTFELWCLTVQQRDTLSAALQTALDAGGGQALEGVGLRRVAVVDQNDGFVSPSDGSERGIYQRSLDVDVWYRDL